MDDKNLLAKRVRAAFVFTIRGDKIARIDLVMAPKHLAELHVETE
jgi:hypothetical protein